MRWSNILFGSISRSGAVEERQLQPVDFQQAAASDALQVAVQPGRRFHDAAAERLDPRDGLRS
jgi:hypothetical protein